MAALLPVAVPTGLAVPLLSAEPDPHLPARPGTARDASPPSIVQQKAKS